MSGFGRLRPGRDWPLEGGYRFRSSVIILCFFWKKDAVPDTTET